MPVVLRARRLRDGRGLRDRGPPFLQRRRRPVARRRAVPSHAARPRCSRSRRKSSRARSTCAPGASTRRSSWRRRGARARAADLGHRRVQQLPEGHRQQHPHAPREPARDAAPPRRARARRRRRAPARAPSPEPASPPAAAPAARRPRTRCATPPARPTPRTRPTRRPRSRAGRGGDLQALASVEFATDTFRAPKSSAIALVWLKRILEFIVGIFSELRAEPPRSPAGAADAPRAARTRSARSRCARTRGRSSSTTRPCCAASCGACCGCCRAAPTSSAGSATRFRADDTSATAAVVRDGVLQRDLELWIGAASPCLPPARLVFRGEPKTPDLSSARDPFFGDSR